MTQVLSLLPAPMRNEDMRSFKQQIPIWSTAKRSFRSDEHTLWARPPEGAFYAYLGMQKEENTQSGLQNKEFLRKVGDDRLESRYLIF
eukprot:2083253-Amphidinium_carterae.1